MASDDPNSAGGFASRPRPTPPTLDLKAEEVRAVPENAPDAPASLPPGEPGKGEPVSSESAVAAASGEDTGNEAPTAEAAGPDAPEKPFADEAPETAEVPAEGPAPVDEAPAHEEPRPAAAAPAQGGAGISVVAALLAGVVGGGIVAAGLVHFARDLGLAPPPPPAVSAVAPPATGDLKSLFQRLAALEARPTFDPAAVTALTSRLADNDKALDALRADLAALKVAPAAAPESAPAAPPAELVAAVDGLKSQLKGQSEAIDANKTALGDVQSGMAAAQSGIETLKRAQDGLQTAVKATSEQAAALAPRIDALTPRLDAFGAELKQAVAATKGLSQSAAAMVVLSALRDSIQAGRPFATELAAARSVLGPAASPLDAFSTQAEKGFGTPAALAQRLASEGLAAFGPAAPAPAATPVDGVQSFLSRLASSAESLVTVRPADEVPPGDPRAPLQAAVAQVRAGAFAEALASLKKLPAPVQAKLEGVTQIIAARNAAVSATVALYQQSLAAISGKMP